MPNTLSWGDVALRLSLAAIAGIIVGFNRGQHGRAAGPRTMLLVCAASALTMILANYIAITGSPDESQRSINVGALRLPQGILAGMGFLGAGAILKRGNLVQGVTTAATLWFISVVGLCFGAGYIGIGVAGSVLAIVALFILPWAERFVHADHMSIVTVVTRHEGITEEELRQRLCTLGLSAENFTIDCQVSEKLKTISCEVEYQRKRALELPPKVIADLSHQPGVMGVKWE